MKHIIVNEMVKRIEARANRRLSSKIYPKNITILTDISYINDDILEHKMDIYFKKNNTKTLPVIIDIHGGAFVCSHKELDKWFGVNLAEKNFLVFNMNYRLASDSIKFPEQIKDIKAAVNYIFEHIIEYNGNEEEVYLIGHSAGAILALLETLNNYQIRGLVLDCGLMNCINMPLPFKGIKNLVFGRNYRKQKFYQQLDWKHNSKLINLPKTYIITNKKDELRNDNLSFYKLLNKMGINSELNYNQFNSLGHMEIIYNTENDANQEIIDKMTTFLRSK